MKLGVNVDHVATLRQARRGNEPDPVEAARICERAGANSIVMHLREDRRHIQDRDLFRAKEVLSIKLNLEMAAVPSIVTIALKLQSNQVTLVPEKRKEQTTESGLDLFRNPLALQKIIDRFKEKGILVSLFIDPDRRQIEQAKRFQADAVEFHTGPYANAKNGPAAEKELGRLNKATTLARAIRLIPHAGHGLDYKNVRPLKKIAGLDELNIGYSIVSRALWVGLERAIHEMLELVS